MDGRRPCLTRPPRDLLPALALLVESLAVPRLTKSSPGNGFHPQRGGGAVSDYGSQLRWLESADEPEPRPCAGRMLSAPGVWGPPGRCGWGLCTRLRPVQQRAAQRRVRTNRQAQLSRGRALVQPSPETVTALVRAHHHWGAVDSPRLLSRGALGSLVKPPWLYHQPLWLPGGNLGPRVRST